MKPTRTETLISHKTVNRREFPPRMKPGSVSLDRLCMEENAVLGAADGYARMAGKPAFTLLHARATLLGGS